MHIESLILIVSDFKSSRYSNIGFARSTGRHDSFRGAFGVYKERDRSVINREFCPLEMYGETHCFQKYR